MTMAMTLKQAFTIWAYDQKNTVLAAKSRDAVQRVLMKKWNDIDLEQITEQCARKIFTSSSAPQEMKAKAASILVHLLQWGAENGHCQWPQFTYDIASPDYEKKKQAAAPKRPVIPTLTEVSAAASLEPSEPLVKVKPEALEKRKAELAARNKPQKETAMEEKKPKRKGRAPRPFAQIDPVTLEVVKVWPTMADAERELNVSNLGRAARLIQKSAGFYWSNAAEADTFKERFEAKVRGIKPEQKPKQEKEQKTKKPVTEILKEAPDEKPVTVQAYSPDVADAAIKSAVRADLAVFTDEELWKELERRGWQGELHKIQVVKMGMY